MLNCHVSELVIDGCGQRSSFGTTGTLSLLRPILVHVGPCLSEKWLSTNDRTPIDKVSF